MLHVDERGHAAGLLGVGDDMQRKGGLAGGLGSVELDDAAAGQAPDAERQVEAERAGGDDLDALLRLDLAELHDGALAELLADLGEDGVEGGIARGFCFLGHVVGPVFRVFWKRGSGPNCTERTPFYHTVGLARNRKSSVARGGDLWYPCRHPRIR